jgi:hypothetical protein
MEEKGISESRVSNVDHCMAAWLAWSLCALSLVLTTLSLWLVALNHSHPNTITYAPWLDNTLNALS